MDFNLQVTLQKGNNLVSKDINGKSDPYCTFGLVNGAGEWVGKTETTVTKYKTLDAHWHARAFFRSSLDKADSIKFEVWDEDKIGKHEFMGQAFVKLSTLKEDTVLNAFQDRELVLNLESRPNKKDKVSGTISLVYSYLTSEKEKALVAQKEEEERKRTEEAKKQAEQLAKERAEVVDELMKSLPGSDGAGSEKIRELAGKVVAKVGKRITDKKILKALLIEVGMWELVKRYALWANDPSKGFDNLPASASVQAAVSTDAANIDAEMDRAWNIFDTDGDGSVDAREIMISLAVLAADLTPAQRAAFFFDVFDADKNGQLDSSELLRVFEADWKQTVAVTVACVRAMLAEKLPAHRHKLGGVVDPIRRKLAVSSAYPGKMVAILLRKCDSDKSGTISKEEFVAFADDTSARLAVQEELKAVIQGMSKDLEPELTAQLERILR